MTQFTLESALACVAPALKEVRAGHPIVLERSGRAVAALISMKDLQLLEEYIEQIEDRLDREEIAKAKAEGGADIPWEEVKAKAGLA